MQTTYYLHDEPETALIISFNATQEPPSYYSPGYQELDIWDIRTQEDDAEVAIVDQDELDLIEQACLDHFTSEARRYAH